MKNAMLIVLGLVIGGILQSIAIGVITPTQLSKIEGTPVKYFANGNQTCYFIYGAQGAAISCL